MALILGLFFAFLWAVDPYGIAPLHVEVVGFNAFKPARLDIDRQLKPFEVWEKQPKTVFLGTSRIQEAFDPAVLDGTEFAPAYNAAIPASRLSENHRHLQLYFALNPSIEHVFLEAFTYEFIYPQPAVPEWSVTEVLQGAVALNFSLDAITAALRTVAANVRWGSQTASVGDGGIWIPPSGFGSNFGMAQYSAGIVEAHRNIADMAVQPTALEALDAIVALCRKHDARLTVILTPSYPWDDYRLYSLGYWPLLEEFYEKLARYENVVSFSQYNHLLVEPEQPPMRWWYDPIHFSAQFGERILQTLSGRADPDTPANFAVPLTAASAETLLADRLLGLRHWMEENPEFVEVFEAAKLNAGGPVERRPQ